MAAYIKSHKTAKTTGGVRLTMVDKRAAAVIGIFVREIRVARILAPPFGAENDRDNNDFPIFLNFSGNNPR